MLPLPLRSPIEQTAPIGPKTVTILGYHWGPTKPWDGFDWIRAELRSHALFGPDYHLGVPWAHPDDRRDFSDDPDIFGIYRIRLKRGWKSFVLLDGVWMVSKAPPATGISAAGNTSRSSTGCNLFRADGI